jgi:diguanylate cyclase (GGDEF)-like protein
MNVQNIMPGRAMELEPDLNTRITAVPPPQATFRGVDCLVIIHAPTHSQLGKRFALDRPRLNIGRGRDNDVVLPNDCVSRRHAALERRGNDMYVLDLTSTNGTFVNDGAQTVTAQRLVPGDQLRIGNTIFKYLSGSDVEAQYHEVIFSMTVTDGLTNVINRKALDGILADEVLRAHRHARPLSLLILDIDHFKRINDTHGHLAGDAVLRSLAALLQKRVRPTDKVGRYGGEEFCAILPETDLQNALHMAEELRTLVAGNMFAAEQRMLQVTISLGVATLTPDMQAEDLYRSADQMLYAAKHSGRNRVCHAAA